MELLENPTIAAILGGVAGAIVAGVISVWIWRKSRIRKRIRAVIRDVTSLLDISSNLKSTLNIEVKGKKIDSLFLTSIDVSNSGNASLVKQDVVIAFPKGTDVIDFSVSTTPAIGFEGLTTSSQDNKINAHAALLNVGERITFEIVTTGNSTDHVDISMRGIDVEEELVDARSGDFGLNALLSEQNLVLLAFVSAIPFFGGFARSMINVGVANRVDNLAKRRS